MNKGTLTWRNLTGRPGRTAALILLVFCLSVTLCAGGLMMTSLRGGLSSLESRLGADVIVMPSKAALKTDLSTLFLQGTIGPYYMSRSTVDKIGRMEGISRMTTQIYLSSMRAGCCSMPIQIIGFDPETDLTIQPWLRESRQEGLEDGYLLVGSKVNAAPGESIKLYNVSFPVAGQLRETGTGLDTAVYCTLETIRQLMTAAIDLGGYSYISGDPADTVSAVYIKVADGVNPEDVADEINVHVRKVKAVQARSMLSDIGDSLAGVVNILWIVMIAVCALVWVILFVVFGMMARERRRELAVYRLLGMSRKMLALQVLKEAMLCGLAGAVAGIAVSCGLLSLFSTLLENSLGLPYLSPSADKIALFALAALGITLLAAILASLRAALKLSRVDPGNTIREGA